MSRKSKGINAERELIHLFWKNNWAAVRIAGSGSMKYPSADVLATNKIRRLAIECKTSREDCKYFTLEGIKQLRSFADMFNSEPWIGMRFDRLGWLFISLDDIETKKNSHSVSKELAKNKGLNFEEIIR